jgi:hypothetical protein
MLQIAYRRLQIADELRQARQPLKPGRDGCRNNPGWPDTAATRLAIYSRQRRSRKEFHFRRQFYFEE